MGGEPRQLSCQECVVNCHHIAMFEHIIALDPDTYNACVTLGYSNLEKGDTDSALESFEQELARHPENYQAHFDMAALVGYQGLSRRGVQSLANQHGTLYRRGFVKYIYPMKAELTAIIEPAPEGGFWAFCPEIPGANGQGETIQEAKECLGASIELLLADRREDMLRGLPADAIQEALLVG